MSVLCSQERGAVGKEARQLVIKHAVDGDAAIQSPNCGIELKDETTQRGLLNAESITRHVAEFFDYLMYESIH